MKKLTASIVAGALMISSMGINAFAANGTPEIKVYGNENSPVTAGDKASFIVRLSDFKAVKGMDLTINANGMVDFTNAEISMDKVTLEKGTNYKVENDTIYIVDLTSADMQKDGYANITVGNATVTAAGDITVTATLAKNGKETVSATSISGKAAVKTLVAKTTTDGETVKASDDKHFIPYGFLTDSEGYILKEKDGSFKKVSADQKYAEYEIPENGITTFAASDHTTERAIQFGTYTTRAADGTTRGTLLFEDWETLKNYYIKECGFSVNDILTKVNELYDAKLKADPTIAGIKVKAGDKEVVVRRVKQTKAMWKVKSKNLLQYAARLKGVNPNTSYTAVGYIIANGNVTFSENMVTSKYGSNN